MNKSELVLEIQNEIGDNCTKACAERALDAVLKAIAKGVKGDKKGVQLVGFGTFKVSERPARDGVNPRTGEKIRIKASKTVAFKAGSALKESL